MKKTTHPTRRSSQTAPSIIRLFTRTRIFRTMKRASSQNLRKIQAKHQRRSCSRSLTIWSWSFRDLWATVISQRVESPSFWGKMCSSKRSLMTIKSWSVDLQIAMTKTTQFSWCWTTWLCQMTVTMTMKSGHRICQISCVPIHLKVTRLRFSGRLIVSWTVAGSQDNFS